ncbi:11507_t:CDS:2, partial [Acaulospora morrowiae]
VGASSTPSKYGNKVLKWYMNNNYSVTPVNPNEDEIDGLKCVPNLSSISNIDPKTISVSVITPSQVSKKVLEEAAELGISCVWLQPGAEDVECQEFANRVGMRLIS